jgi:hypothetical protein
MRWVAAAVLLGFLFAGDPLAGEPKCEQAFIEQEVHRSKVRMTTSRASEDAFVPGVQATLGRWRATFRLFLVFNSLGPWQYDKCHTVLVLADGQRVPLGVATYEGFYLGGDTVSETIAVPLDGKAIAQLGSVSRLKLKVCNSEVKVPEEFVCTLHELACKVREWRSGGRNLEQCEPKPRPGPHSAPPR